MSFEIASTMPARLKGLLGRSGFGGVLLLAPCRDIHTFGMRRPIDVAFVSADGAVIESHRNVAPRRRLRNRKAAATLERFSADAPWFAPGDRIRVPLPPATRSADAPRPQKTKAPFDRSHV